MKKTIIYSILLAFAATSFAQAQVPPPADPQSGPIMLKGATAHLGNGEVIENSVIAFDNGKLTVVGTSGSESGHTVIDVSGKHIYPGLMLVNTTLGLEEVSSINDMSDNREQGDFNPNVRSQIAFNTDSENIPVFRFNGILLAEPTPRGGNVSGSSSVMMLDGWNWEDATLKEDVAIHMDWPGRMRRNFDFSTFTVTFGPNQNYDRDVKSLKENFADAVSYSKLAGNKETNLKMEAMRGLFDGSKTLMIHVSGAKEIVEAVKFAQEMGVKKIGVVAGSEAIIAGDFLAENEIPVVVPSIHGTPDRTDDDYDMGYRLAVELHKKGVEVILSHEGMIGLARNLPFFAGTTVAYGVDKEEAIKMVTLNPANLLGVGDRVGSLEVGKDATLFITEGDALDYSGNILSHAFIQGRQVQLDARQQWLNNKYAEKYDH